MVKKIDGAELLFCAHHSKIILNNIVCMHSVSNQFLLFESFYVLNMVDVKAKCSDKCFSESRVVTIDLSRGPVSVKSYPLSTILDASNVYNVLPRESYLCFFELLNDRMNHKCDSKKWNVIEDFLNCRHYKWKGDGASKELLNLATSAILLHGDILDPLQLSVASMCFAFITTPRMSNTAMIHGCLKALEFFEPPHPKSMYS